MTAAKTISPQALLQTIKLNLVRTPFFQPETVMDILHLTRAQVKEKIQDGTFPWAFDIGESKRRTEPRILALSVVEQQLGPLPAIGRTRNLELPEVMALILPSRDIRSTELRRILSCDSDLIRNLKRDLVVTQGPQAADGPTSFSVFSRASVVGMLAKRRMN